MNTYTIITTLFFLLVVHALCDYPLQGDFLAKAKASAFEPEVPWYQAMIAHCLIHAGGVALVTGSVYLAAVEFCMHFLIDKLKTRGELTFNADQFLHVLCKVMYVFIMWIGGALGVELR